MLSIKESVVACLAGTIIGLALCKFVLWPAHDNYRAKHAQETYNITINIENPPEDPMVIEIAYPVP